MLFESPVQFHVGYLVLIRDGLFYGIFVEDPRGNRTGCTWVKKQDTNPDEMHHLFRDIPQDYHKFALFVWSPQRWFPGRSQPSKNPWKKIHQLQASFLGWPNLLQPTSHVGKLQQKFRYLTRHGDVHIKKLSVFLEVQRTTPGFIFQPLDIFNGKPLSVSREGFFSGTVIRNSWQDMKRTSITGWLQMGFPFHGWFQKNPHGNISSATKHPLESFSNCSNLSPRQQKKKQNPTKCAFTIITNGSP